MTLHLVSRSALSFVRYRILMRTVTGRAVFVMPEGLSDCGDDSEGGHGGKAFSVEGLGEQWDLFVSGPLSDQVQP